MPSCSNRSSTACAMACIDPADCTGDLPWQGRSTPANGMPGGNCSTNGRQDAWSAPKPCNSSTGTLPCRHQWRCSLGLVSAAPGDDAEVAGTSRPTMRPPGPLPLSLSKSTPRSRARLRASGVARKDAPSDRNGSCAAVPTMGSGGDIAVAWPGSGTAAVAGVPGGWGGGGGGGGALDPRSAGRPDPGDPLTHRHRHTDRAIDAVDHAARRSLHLHRRLVGLDVEQHLALAHMIAVLHVPAGDFALGHIHVDTGQDDFGGHAQALPRTVCCTAATMSGTWGTAARSRSGLYGNGQSAPPRRKMGASRR